MSLTQAQRLGLDSSHLVWLESERVYLSAATKAAFLAMQQAALMAGHQLNIASGWRSFDRQLRIWNEKWRGQRPLLDANSQPLDASQLSETEKIAAIRYWSALPGTSRHHFGTDIDVYDASALPVGKKLQLEPWEYQTGGYFADLSDWLGQHCALFGFYRPYDGLEGRALEPWHLSLALEADAQPLALTALADALSSSEIEGKTLILENLTNWLPREL